MTESVRFLGRQTRLQSSPIGAVGKIDPLALTAMQQTGKMVPQQTGRGSQRFLQGGLSAPITVTWEITAACNIACVHCLSSSGRRRPRELTTQQSLALVDEFADMQVFQLHFGGGEPFIYPGIWQVLERCTTRGLVMCVSTNGTLITPERARRLKQFDPLYFQVSLDGGTPQTNDSIRGKGVFNRALRGLDRATGLFLKVVEQAPDPDAIKQMVAERTPMGRLGTADDVCESIMFLAGEESSYISGAVFPLDGGLAARRM